MRKVELLKITADGIFEGLQQQISSFLKALNFKK